jgi:hypothetical protein
MYPEVAMNNNGDALVVWYQKDGTTNDQIFKSEYRSGSWTHPTSLTDNISPDGTSASVPQVAMDNNGNAIIAWQQSDNITGLQIFKSEYRSGTWTHPANLTDNISPAGNWIYSPQIGMGDNGDALITWFQHNGSVYQVFKSEYRSGGWTHPVNVSDNISPDGQDAKDQQVAMDSRGNAIIVWKQSDGSGEQIFQSVFRFGTWTHPVNLTDNISPDGIWGQSPQVAMDDNGNSIIIWCQIVSGVTQVFKSEYR